MSMKRLGFETSTWDAYPSCVVDIYEMPGRKPWGYMMSGVGKDGAWVAYMTHDENGEPKMIDTGKFSLEEARDFLIDNFEGA